jgi:hypothetical protein
MAQRLSVAITEALRAHCCQVLDRLLGQAAGNSDPVTGFPLARQALEALPLTTAEFGLAVNRLANAERYLQAGERGAACFELNLLRRRLES